MSANTIFQTEFKDLNLVNRGKVRDIYEVDGYLLMVISDRISAFDVVMNEPVAHKGEVLTALSLFWFDFLQDIIPNHLVTADVNEYPPICAPYLEELRGRSMLVKKARPLPVECIVRGYISGSLWAEYKEGEEVSGLDLPAGMQESDKFAEPIFTPSTKADLGLHDQNISLAAMEDLIGPSETAMIVDVCIRLYKKAADYALEKGIIIADTKFELGWYEGKLILIDEALTPDSSRFWPLDQYKPGSGQPSFDKQFLRDYLLTLDWGKQPPPPKLPDEIIEKTGARYLEARKRITGV